MTQNIWKNAKDLLARVNEEQNLDDVSNKFPKSTAEFAQKYRIIKNKAFSFVGREYLIPIYEDQSNEIYIVKGRQVEATESIINILLHFLITNPGTVGLYVTDRFDHVKYFSKVRLRKEAIGKSTMLKSLTVKKGNEEYLEFTNESILLMKSGWKDFEQARSFAVDIVVIDEMQSLNANAITVVKESLSKSEHGRLIVVGTGSEMGSEWEKLWNTGNQQEWDINLKKWIAKNPDSDGISSYHISQLMVPWISPKEIEKKRNGNPRYFVTEVQGWWYMGQKKPLIEMDIRNLFDVNLDFHIPSDEELGRPILLGCDWGGGSQAYTVVWIWQLVKKAAPRFRLLYAAKISERSTEIQADIVIDLINKYHVDQAVIDSGGGARQVEKITKMFGSRVTKCNYIVRPGQTFEIVHSENRINVDRTWVIETIIDLITRQEFGHPDFPNGIPRIQVAAMYPEKILWIINHFTCIEAQTSESEGMSYTRYIHPDGTNDDALHACCYAYLASLVWKNRQDGYPVAIF